MTVNSTYDTIRFHKGGFTNTPEPKKESSAHFTFNQERIGRVFNGLDKDTSAKIMNFLPVSAIARVAMTSKYGDALATNAKLVLAKEYGYEEESQQEPREYLKNLFAGIRALTEEKLLPKECIAQDPEETLRKLIYLPEVEKRSFQSTWNTALLKSTELGYVEAAQILITIGADVNAQGQLRNTPLFT